MNNLREALGFLGVDPEESSKSTLAFEIAEALMGQQGAEYSTEDEQKTEQAAEIIGEVLLSVLKGER